MDIGSIHTLIDRYFNAETTIEEEKLLLDEVLKICRDGTDPKMDEYLAVMGYTVSRGNRHVRGAGRSFWRENRIIGSVAAAAIVIVSVWSLLIIRNGASVSYDCYAYVDGVFISDRQEISSLIDMQLSDMEYASGNIREVVSSDLEDMSDAFNFEEI